MHKLTLPKRRTPACLLVLCLLPQSLWAQQDEDLTADRIELDPLIVVASKTPRLLSDVAAQVTVIDDADIRHNMAEDLGGMLRYEPGLELETAGTRFGATGINLRGIGGNRVVIEQDGIPLRDRFVVGAFSDGGRALVETDRIKRVEVLHGPASVLYGSNALGGVVAITTWDPADLLGRAAGKPWFGLRGGYQGANDSWVESGVAAVGEGAHGVLVAATYRQGHQLDNQAAAEIPDDPQDWDGRDLMLRYTFDTSGGNRLRLTVTGQERDVDTSIHSQLGFGQRFRTTTALRGVDHDENQRYSLDYEFSWAGWQQGRVQAYTTEYQTRQLTFETRAKARPPVALERQFFYRQQHSGVDLNLFRQEQWGSTRHRIGLGLEWLQTDSAERRDGLQTSLLDGSTTKLILGEVLPVRDFPNSRSEELGLFVQDEIGLADGRWELSPALRWDKYQLDPEPDSLWLQDFPDTEVVAVSANKFTPRLSLLFHGPRDWSFYAQYARGFRAPPFEDANIGLDIPLFGFRAIPNPDLKSETSNGFELGARRMVAGAHFSLALFHTDYDNFIETRALIGVDAASGDLIFQSRNIDRARIYGLDLRYEQDLGQWSDILQGWRLNLAAYWSEGENRESGQSLNSIAPPQAVIGISWSPANGNWDLGATTTLTAAKDEQDIDQTRAVRFATRSWGIVDLTAGWRYSDHLELRAGIFNLGDKKYWRWLDVANRDVNDPMIALLSRPGRNYSVTARFSF
jgi:hemoglobin/transferrin/lactoferrin receptor protein